MPKFKKEILKPGTYKSPDGNVEISPARISHWVSQFSKMKTAGLKIPSPWGHHSKGDPNEKEFLESKYNAGFIDSLIEEDGTLKAIFDVPRAEDAERVGTVIQEVSPQIEIAWRDGKGRTWNDVITHVALVTHPVVPGQTNFEKLPDDPVPAFAMRLSLKNYVGEKDMADDVMDLDKEKKTKQKPSASAFEGKESDKEEEKEEGGEEKSTAPEGKSPKAIGKEIDKELLAVLKEIGLDLPTDLKNLNEFVIALKASAMTLKSHLDEMDNDQGDNQNTDPKGKDSDSDFQDINLEDLEKELQAQGGAANKEQPMPDKTPDKVQEQQPSYQMSTKEKQRLSLVETKLEEADKKNMRVEIHSLLQSGRITPVMAEKLEREVRTYKLSLNDNGDVTPSLVQGLIEGYKGLPEGCVWTSDEKVRLSNKPVEHDLPVEFKTLDGANTEKVIQEQLRGSGRGVAFN